MSDKMPQVISLESELVGVEQKSEGVELERIRIIFLPLLPSIEA